MTFEPPQSTRPPATTAVSPLLDRPGAVAASWPDHGVAAHYGDPLREARMLDEGHAVVDVSHRGVVRVAGPDRLSWLHALTSQHVSALAPGDPVEALVLDPQGHVEHHVRIVDDGTASWLSVEPGSAAVLAAWLDSMRFLLRVEVADVTDDWAVLWRAAPVGRAGVEELVPRSELTARADAMGPLAGVWAYEALRIAAHRARLGLDTDAKTLPNEVGWIGSAVHLEKGCYRGQETVARVHNLGRPPRRLTLLHCDGSADHLPAHGADVLTTDGERVGFVGSSARHHELGPIALALLRRTVPVDAPLLAEGVAVAQETVVDPDVGLHIKARLG